MEAKAIARFVRISPQKARLVVNLVRGMKVEEAARILEFSRKRAAGPAKSKRDLMTAVLNMDARPSYVPAGFFMHFGVKGDAAIKAHMDHFRGTGMDFVKIQFDEQTLNRQPWEPSVKALVHYPAVIQTMIDHPDWTQALGAAFLVQPNDVMDSVQRLRREAAAVEARRMVRPAAALQLHEGSAARL